MANLTPEAVEATLEGATPGPWQVAGTRHSGDLKIGQDTRLLMVGPDDDAVSVVFFDMKTGRGHNDARLIAMTPDLAREYLRLKEVEKAGKALARQLLEAVGELQECSVELTGEDYNSPAHNEALAAFRAAVEGK